MCSTKEFDYSGNRLIRKTRGQPRRVGESIAGFGSEVCPSIGAPGGPGVPIQREQVPEWRRCRAWPLSGAACRDASLPLFCALAETSNLSSSTREGAARVDAFLAVDMRILAFNSCERPSLNLRRSYTCSPRRIWSRRGVDVSASSALKAVDSFRTMSLQARQSAR